MQCCMACLSKPQYHLYFGSLLKITGLCSEVCSLIKIKKGSQVNYMFLLCYFYCRYCDNFASIMFKSDHSNLFEKPLHFAQNQKIDRYLLYLSSLFFIYQGKYSIVCCLLFFNTRTTQQYIMKHLKAEFKSTMAAFVSLSGASVAPFASLVKENQG